MLLNKKIYYATIIINVFCMQLLLANTNDKEKAVKETIEQELRLYPKATLQDLYKNFFQGRFGPGHMISSIEDASNYLKEELQSSTEYDSVLWQPVGYEQRYYRVNLCLVRDGKISFDQLLAAFTAKQDSAAHTNINEWKSEWHTILSIIEKMNINLPDFEKDKLHIEGNLEKGIVAGHHSEVFTQIYNPHYRIVSNREFKELYKAITTQPHPNK